MGTLLGTLMGAGSLGGSQTCCSAQEGVCARASVGLRLSLWLSESVCARWASVADNERGGPYGIGGRAPVCRPQRAPCAGICCTPCSAVGCTHHGGPRRSSCAGTCRTKRGSRGGPRGVCSPTEGAASHELRVRLKEVPRLKIASACCRLGSFLAHCCCPGAPRCAETGLAGTAAGGRGGSPGAAFRVWAQCCAVGGLGKGPARGRAGASRRQGRPRAECCAQRGLRRCNAMGCTPGDPGAGRGAGAHGWLRRAGGGPCTGGVREGRGGLLFTVFAGPHPQPSCEEAGGAMGAAPGAPRVTFGGAHRRDWGGLGSSCTQSLNKSSVRVQGLCSCKAPQLSEGRGDGGRGGCLHTRCG